MQLGATFVEAAKAKRYLEDVIVSQAGHPLPKVLGGCGCTAQAKAGHSNRQSRWPVKSARFILDLLKNAESNADVWTSITVLFLFWSLHSKCTEVARTILQSDGTQILKVLISLTTL